MCPSPGNPPPGPITSVANRHVVEARKLRLRKHREEQGRFLLEGLQLLHMALDAGVQPDTVFYCEEQFAGPEAPRLMERFAGQGAQLLRVSAAVLAALSEREGPQGIVAAFRLFRSSPEELRLPDDGLVVVLDRLQDPGNLGTLIRTADAVAAAAVISLEPAVDLFDPRAVRASMGSLFNLPIATTAAPGPLFRLLTDRGLRVVGTSEHHGEPWGDRTLRGGVALILGNEARGLSPDIAAHVTGWVSLPMAGKAESLNVAIAGAVLMYQWLRVNRPAL